MTREQKIDAAVRAAPVDLAMLKWMAGFLDLITIPGMNPRNDLEFTLVCMPILADIRREFAKL